MAWSHRELNTKPILKGIEYNVKHGYDIFRRPGFGKLQYLQLDNNLLPSILMEYSEKYKNLIGPVIIQENIFQRIVQSFYFKITSRLYKIFK